MLENRVTYQNTSQRYECSQRYFCVDRIFNDHENIDIKNNTCNQENRKNKKKRKSDCKLVIQSFDQKSRSENQSRKYLDLNVQQAIEKISKLQTKI